MRQKQTSYSVIAGYGEIGQALNFVLNDLYEVKIVDPSRACPLPNEKDGRACDVLHVCFPPIPGFIKEVKRYQKFFKPKYTVIHSSVPIGTSKKCKAYHSPVRGVHPNLVKGLKTFTKFLGPESKVLKRYFEQVGIPIMTVNDSRETEALKLWDTTYYGWNIIFQKLLFKWCEDNRIDPKIVYTLGNMTYNEGYTNLGRKEVIRPVLKHMEGPIGGHCVMQNLDLFKSPINEFIRRHNKLFKMSKLPKTSR